MTFVVFRSKQFKIPQLQCFTHTKPKFSVHLFNQIHYISDYSSAKKLIQLKLETVNLSINL